MTGEKSYYEDFGFGVYSIDQNTPEILEDDYFCKTPERKQIVIILPYDIYPFEIKIRRKG